jgi:hypothetical protein
MSDGEKILFGCAGVLLYSVVTFVITCVGDYFVCWMLWRGTGNDGYMEAGWVFAFLAWPVVFVAGAFVVIPMIRRPEKRAREEHRDQISP